MTWTTDVPAQSGQYWMKDGDNDPIIVNVVEWSVPGCACVRPALVAYGRDPLNGREQWEGPIVPPD